MFTDYRLDERKLSRSLYRADMKSLVELCQRSGVHRNTLYQYSSGKKSILPSALLKLAKALDIDPLDLVKPGSARELKLSALDQLQSLVAPVAKKLPRAALMLIGSRAKKRAKAFSDFDIAVTGGPERLSTEEYLDFKLQIEDAVEDFPYSVDCINFDQAPGWFLRGISSTDPQFLAGDRESFAYARGVIDAYQNAELEPRR